MLYYIILYIYIYIYYYIIPLILVYLGFLDSRCFQVMRMPRCFGEIRGTPGPRKQLRWNWISASHLEYLEGVHKGSTSKSQNVQQCYFKVTFFFRVENSKISKSILLVSHRQLAPRVGFRLPWGSGIMVYIAKLLLPVSNGFEKIKLPDPKKM